jgi:hypothetical protein
MNLDKYSFIRSIIVMSGIVPNEGKHLVAQLIFKNTDVDRGTGLELGLFTNSAIDATITAVSVREPTGGSYLRKALIDANWSVVEDIATYGLQVFTATGAAYTGAVYGYFIITKGATPRIVAIEVDATGPYTLAENDTYAITPSITTV